MIPALELVQLAYANLFWCAVIVFAIYMCGRVKKSSKDNLTKIFDEAIWMLTGVTGLTLLIYLNLCVLYKFHGLVTL